MPSPADVADRSIQARLLDILAEQYASSSCITFHELALRLYRETGLDWWYQANSRKVLFSLLNALNRTEHRCILSACVVGSGQMPASGFFDTAIRWDQLAPEANALARTEFWLGQYTMAQRVCEALGLL